MPGAVEVDGRLRKSNVRAGGGVMLTRGRGEQDGKIWKEARRAVKAALARADGKARDAVARGIAHNPDWFPLFPDVVDPKENSRIRVVSPLEYLGVALGAVPRRPLDRLLLDGGFHLSCDGDVLFLGGHKVDGGGTGRCLVELPRAFVRGDFSVVGAQHLRTIEVVTSGSIRLSQLPALQTLRGEVLGEARLRDTGLRRIGADFRCAAGLSIFQHPHLQSLNCEVGGRLTVISSSLKGTGPAFRAAGELNIAGPPSIDKHSGGIDQVGTGRPNGVGKFAAERTMRDRGER
jgi:hypothetical protein